MCRGERDSVITSYSIHYTKLYDGLAREQERDPIEAQHEADGGKRPPEAREQGVGTAPPANLDAEALSSFKERHGIVIELDTGGALLAPVVRNNFV